MDKIRYYLIFVLIFSLYNQRKAWKKVRELDVLVVNSVMELQVNVDYKTLQSLWKPGRQFCADNNLMGRYNNNNHKPRLVSGHSKLKIY